MNTATAPHEVRFTTKRACIWNGITRRWYTISQDTARLMIATGEAIELKKGEWL